jgi:prephenate dehydratase
LNVVAYQGEPGAYSEEAAQILGGPHAMFLACRTFEDVVAAVLNESASAGILPLENSQIGQIAAANRALGPAPLRIEKELTLPIHHCLLAQTGATLAALRKAVSHPAALAQCQLFFAAHPHIAPTEWYDTAGGAKHVATLGDATIAAVASRRAARHYGLVVIADNIEDRSDNSTRFAMVVKQ